MCAGGLQAHTDAGSAKSSPVMLGEIQLTQPVCQAGQAEECVCGMRVTERSAACACACAATVVVKGCGGGRTASLLPEISIPKLLCLGACFDRNPQGWHT